LTVINPEAVRKTVPSLLGRSAPAGVDEVRYEDVAVLVPCYNEEITIGKVVDDFHQHLPGARVYVYDNNSKDRTAAIAQERGAIVVRAPRQGKGNVVRQMFEEVEAEVYLMVDGDDTYPASSARELIAALHSSGADMVVGTRIDHHQEKAFRRFHRFGNWLVAKLIRTLFAVEVADVMSGYRVFSKSFVKSIPLMSKGFDIETEMTLQAASKHFVIRECPIQYGQRPEGSYSKLSTFSDGMVVLKAIFMIFKDYKPLTFFSSLSVLLLLLCLTAGVWPVLDYFTTGYVSRVPLAILASGLGIVAMMSLSIGLILDTISKYHNENFQLLRRLLKK
jgi:glycosyltransferase involved in cell wall biosynthesis